MKFRFAILSLLTGLGPALAAASESSSLPFKPAVDPDLPAAHQWLWALLLCALALGLALWWLKRAPQGRWPVAGGKKLQVLERQVLAPGTQLVLVRYRQREMLLSVGPSGTQCLRDEPNSEGGALLEPEPKS